MGNYYEGELIFGLKRELPDNLLHDLLFIGSDQNHGENIQSLLLYENLKSSKWMNHERAMYPSYNLEFNEGIWCLGINFCMKGYRYQGDDLGQDIYDFLHPYIDQTAYDMTNGGYIGKIEDEDGTYRKEFYVDYDQFNALVKSRQYLCKGCYKGIAGSLCNTWSYCKRAYDIGRGGTNEDS